MTVEYGYLGSVDVTTVSTTPNGVSRQPVLQANGEPVYTPAAPSPWAQELQSGDGAWRFLKGGSASVASGATLDFQTDFTVLALCRLTKVHQYNIFAAKRTTGNGWVLHSASSSAARDGPYVRFDTAGGTNQGGRFFNNNNTFARRAYDMRWHWLGVAVVNATQATGTMRNWWNGERLTDATFTGGEGGVSDVTAPLTLRAAGGAGVIAAALIYNRVLTDTEVSNIMSGKTMPKDVSEGDGDGDDDGEDLDADEDEDEDEEGEVATAKPAKKAADDSQAADSQDSADDDSDAEFRSSYQVKLPEDFDDQVKSLDEREAEIARKFKAGEIEADEFLAENREISGERSKLDRIATKAEIASEMGEQTELQRWNWTVDRFMREVKKAEGIDYKTEKDGIGADLDTFVKVLANNPANADKPMEWFLSEAHKRTKALHGLAAGKQDDAGDEKAKRKKATDSRKPDASKIPASLAQVPGGDGPGDVENEFADIDKLDGLAYEQALAKMTPTQRERYLATA